MNEKVLRELYESRKYGDEITENAVDIVKKLENFLEEKYGSSLEKCDREQVRKYVEKMVSERFNDLNNFMALARYFYLTDRKDIYIFFTSVLGGIGVIENIQKRTENFEGKEKLEEIFDGLEKPPLGTTPEDFPEYTEELMKRLGNCLPKDKYRKILAGNNHGVPETAFSEEKELFEASESLEKYLKERHDRKVAELQKHCDEEKVWYEQIITQEIVDYVKSNQEILSAVVDGSVMLNTKIPYATKEFMEAEDPKMKRYYTCHCPFAREAIIKGDTDIPLDWCYCSGGFQKFGYDVIFGEETEVEVLESVLTGDERCRFAIKIPDRIMKKYM